MEEMTREIEVDSDPARAWQAISDQDELSRWLGGEVEIDLVPGGTITVEEDGVSREGFVESVEEGAGLSFWWAEGDEESTRVELEVIPGPEGDGCVIRVTESRPLAGIERELADITALAQVV